MCSWKDEKREGGGYGKGEQRVNVALAILSC